MNNFFVRLFTGIIYISVITGSILYNQTSFIIVGSLLFSIATYESHIIWLKVEKKEGYYKYPYYQLSILLSFFFFVSIPYGGWGYNEIYNPYSILLIFILIWITDTMSYIIGVKFGKNKIDKRVSPNKTWEGFFGGFLFCILFSIFSFNYLQEIYPFWKTISLGMVIPIFSLIGDMGQSKLKRKAGVKNSGFLIPGHGGIYDRLDSTICVAPIAFIITII
ncbi:MAG: phosphatidate cytidylyltransferase [Candidatus Marisimplicoccus sp.]|tara:strand:+ start:805 stop:1464 length:660 start_codon:yes stop_codon:yes gene_type:complete